MKKSREKGQWEVREREEEGEWEGEGRRGGEGDEGEGKGRERILQLESAPAAGRDPASVNPFMGWGLKDCPRGAEGRNKER